MASWSWFSLQCPFECRGGQGGQRWVMGQCGSSGLPGCPGGTGNRPQHREWTQVPFSSLLPWGLSRAWERVNVSVLILGDAAQLCLPPGQPQGHEDEHCPWDWKELWQNPTLLIPWEPCWASGHSSHNKSNILLMPSWNGCLSPCFAFLMPTFLCIKLSSQVKCLELRPFTRMWLPHGLLAVSRRNTPFPRKELHAH